MQEAFPKAIRNSLHHGKGVLMDVCPRQHSRKALDDCTTVVAIIMKIPARSPNLKLMENSPPLVKKAIKRQTNAENITQEAFKEFSARVEQFLREFPIATIDKCII